MARTTSRKPSRRPSTASRAVDDDAGARAIAGLAVIDAIQQGIARSLGFQGVVDLAGDKLRELFRTGDLGIGWWDAAAGIMHPLYEYEHGVRLQASPRKPADAWLAVAASRRPLVLNDRAEQAAVGSSTVPGTDTALSIVVVPIEVRCQE